MEFSLLQVVMTLAFFITSVVDINSTFSYLFMQIV